MAGMVGYGWVRQGEVGYGRYGEAWGGKVWWDEVRYGEVWHGRCGRVWLGAAG